MGEKEEDAAASAPRRQAMRIYIGGVGPTVAASDVEKTFSPLGRVAGVEFVRTNGRNFAYMDFEPTSEKTLAKLFSAYNGCTWKGGKLKLERAKESYLDRLKREWAEDAKLISETPIDPKIEKDLGSSKLQRLTLESMQLQIFFPKLRKVRSLPFKGTGKHKYSFQRIEVPPLPIHFCDCEEHCGASETASQKYLSYLNSGIHYEKELNIMNSVMNKLFEKESNGLIADKDMMLATAENATDPSIDDICEEESEEALEMDTDNLVTNIGIGRTDDMLMQLAGYTQAVNQESRASKHQSSKKELSRNKENTKKKGKRGCVDASEVTANKKDNDELPVKITENEFTAILSRNMSSEGHFQEPDVSAEPPHDKGQTEPSMIATQSANGQSWLQKSSWKDLVGGMGKSSFSITNVLPGTSLLLPTKSQSSDSAADTLIEAKRIKAHPARKSSKTLPALQDPCLEKAKTKKGQKAGPVDALHATANKKSNPELPVKFTENEFTAILPQNTSSDGQSSEPEISVEPPADKGQAEPSSIATQSTKGQSWLHKSSWKDLVGGMESSSFSITNVLPGISSLQTTQPKSIDSLTEAKKIKAQADRNTPKTSSAVKNSPLEKASAADGEMLGKGDHIQAHAVGDEQRKPTKTGDQEPRSTRPEVGTSEVCTFMRSDESLKQWAKAKAALSRQLNKKRKRSEDDSPKSLKGARLRKR